MLLVSLFAFHLGLCLVSLYHYCNLIKLLFQAVTGNLELGNFEFGVEPSIHNDL